MAAVAVGANNPTLRLPSCVDVRLKPGTTSEGKVIFCPVVVVRVKVPLAVTASRNSSSSTGTNRLVFFDETTVTDVPKLLAPVNVTSPVPPVKEVAPVTVNGPPLIPTAVAVKLLTPNVVPKERAPFVTSEIKFPLMVKSARVKVLEL